MLSFPGSLRFFVAFMQDAISLGEIGSIEFILSLSFRMVFIKLLTDSSISLICDGAVLVRSMLKDLERFSANKFALSNGEKTFSPFAFKR